MKFDPTINWGHIIVAISVSTSTIAGAAIAWTNLTGTIESNRQAAVNGDALLQLALEAAKAAAESRDQIQSIRLDALEPTSTAIDNLTERMVRVETQLNSMAQDQQEIKGMLQQVINEGFN